MATSAPQPNTQPLVTHPASTLIRDAGKSVLTALWLWQKQQATFRKSQNISITSSGNLTRDGLPLTIWASDVATLDDEAAEALMGELILSRWARLLPEYDDPLTMLYQAKDAAPARHWTLGWFGVDLYLLVWETDTWQGAPRWLLYINGRPVYSKVCNEDSLFHHYGQEILEGDRLPAISWERLLARLSDFSLPVEQRTQATQHLTHTLLNAPWLVSSLALPLAHALGANLNEPWPTLDMLKLNRLAGKNTLIKVLAALVKSGLIQKPEHKLALSRALNHVELAYRELAGIISPLLQDTYQEAFKTFQNTVNEGFWRVQLLQFSLSASHTVHQKTGLDAKK